MNEKKNIDRLFQEKFKDFEVAPSEAVWNRINESLPNKKKKRRVIALWWQVGGVAAAIALLLTIGVSIFNTDSNNDLPVVNSEIDSENKLDDTRYRPSTDSNANQNQNKIDNSKLVDSENDQNQLNELNDTQDNTATKTKNEANKLGNPNPSKQPSNSIVNNSESLDNKKSDVNKNSAQKQNRLTNANNKAEDVKVAANEEKAQINSNSADNSKLATENELKTTLKNTIEKNLTTVADNNATNTSKSDKSGKTETTEIEKAILQTIEEQSIEEAIAEQTNSIIEKEEDKQNRWSVAPNVAPVYYSSIGQGSSLDQQFNENAKSSPVNMSYGITGSYALSEKLKIRTGVNRVNLNQTTSDVFAFTGAETAARGVGSQFSNIAFKDGAQGMSMMSSNMLNRSSAPEVFNTKAAGDLDQRFGFLEVPLEIEYRLVDSKFGVNVIGGFSTLFLNQNEIYADIDGATTFIGEANNINDTSFSANFGLGMDYSLSKQWYINLEPTLKYQINTFNNTSGNFRPFFIGVYTGLSFKF